MQMMNKFTAVICVIFLMWAPIIAYADDTPPTSNSATNSLGKVSSLRIGQRAPFSGVLLSNDAAARLFGDIKFSERECQLRLDRELKINTLQLTSQLNALKLRLNIETERTESLLSIKDERIKFLEKNWQPEAWYETGEFWFAVGIVSGILITVGGAYAIGQAAK